MIWIYTFLLFSHQKKVRGDLFHFGVFQQDQRTFPKRNEQEGAQTLVAIDISVKKNLIHYGV